MSWIEPIDFYLAKRGYSTNGRYINQKRMYSGFIQHNALLWWKTGDRQSLVEHSWKRRDGQIETIYSEKQVKNIKRRYLYRSFIEVKQIVEANQYVGTTYSFIFFYCPTYFYHPIQFWINISTTAKLSQLVTRWRW